MNTAAFPPIPAALALFLCLAGPAIPATTPEGLVPGRFGLALNATAGAARLPATPAAGQASFTVECWARLEGKSNFNILVASEPKNSPTHWEIFTMRGTGHFTAFLPGRSPNHVHSGVAVADGQWHHLAMILEPAQARLFVDGQERCRTALSSPPRPAPGKPGPLSIGTLVEESTGCQGLIDEVRLTSGVAPVQALPEAPVPAASSTLGLWRFDTADRSSTPDASSAAVPALLISRTASSGRSYPPLPQMSAAFQPLPPAPDAAPLRRELEEIVARLQLRSLAPAAVRDAVFHEWLHDFTWHGKLEYPGGRSVFYQDQAAVQAQVCDAHSLIREDDGGPAGTALRRTGALIAHFEKAGWKERIAPAARDFAALQAFYAAERPAPGSPLARPCYLAACALRRQVALANPLLDFDSLLGVARGTFAGSVRSNPVTKDPQGGHFTTQYFGFNALPGGGLFRIRNFKSQPEAVDLVRDSVVENGRLQGKKLTGGAFATPDLHFDGQTIVFAWVENHEHRWSYSQKTCWHLFSVRTDGSGLRQLTDGAWNDFDPCWLPSGRIAFVSERRGGYIRCFAGYLQVRNYTLFSMNADGSDIVPMSYFETSEWNPAVNHEGQVIYTRWDYVDRANCLGTRLWICGPDGSDPRAPHGNYPHPYHTFPDHTPWKIWNNQEWDSRLGTPMVQMGTRAIPGSPLYVFTAAPHHGEVYGSLCLLDLRQADDGHMAQVRRITPEEPFPESEQQARRHYKYGAPWPLSEDFYLCNAWENLCLVDRYGNRELLCELTALPCAHDERLRLTEPIPLRPRPAPPVIPVKTRQGAQAPADAPQATIAVMNVYDSDLPFPPDARIKWLRVTQNIPKTNHAMGEPMIGYERENTPRIPLGIVPVEADGSAYFEAPVAKELIFQVLDEDYRAVQSMRSVAYVHPGEQLTCQGCHEPRLKTPAQTRQPLALQRPPSPLQPEIGPVEPISYYRHIKPIFESRCASCHHAQGKEPRDLSYGALKEDFTFWFGGAMGWEGTRAYSGVHGGSRTIPGRFGARACRIGRALFDANHRDAVSSEDRHTIVVWLDSNSLRLGAYEREDAQLRGELVWPELDVDPENVLGVEGRGKPLRGHFWHENLWGPHAILGTSHTLKSIYLLNERGEKVWDYPVPNPQDVWMLPNGNILTTWLHGVKEVTRGKQVLWEYTVKAPDEVPTCQPLPDGKVLLGIAGQCRLVEVDRKGRILHEVRLATTEKKPHAQFRMCRKTPEGTYLVPFTAEGAVREYDRAGKVLREFPRKPSPVCALRLSNGNTLISAGQAVTDYDASDRIVWELTAEDLPDIKLAILAGIQRLPNNNTLVCNWNAQDSADRAGAHIFEVTPAKQVVWKVTGPRLGQVAQCQLLRPDLTPVTGGIR